MQYRCILTAERHCRLFACWLLLTSICFGSEPQKEPDAVVDFGWAKLDQPVRKRIELSNESNQPVKIQHVSVSCDCLNILQYSDQIAAHGSGYLDVLLLPDKTDEVNDRIHIEYADNAGNWEILFKGIVDDAQNKEFHGYGNLKHLLHYAVLGRTHTEDPALYVTAQSLGPMPLLVDVRNAAEFKQAHIPSSLNIPPYAIQTKQFLRNRQVVLVSRGPETEDLEGLCRALRTAGFKKTYILNGGIIQWAAAGKPVEGIRPDGVRSHLVTTDQMRAVEGSPKWNIILADAKTDIRAQVLVPNGIHVPFTDAVSYAEQLKKRLATDNGHSKNILIVTKDGQLYSSLKVALKDMGMPVYYLAGGLDAYVGKLRMLVEMEDRQTATVSYSPSKKKVSGHIQGGRKIKKKCGCSG